MYLTAIDVANNRAFFLTNNFIIGPSPNLTITAYDLNTFLPVGTISIPGFNGGPGSAVRWGTNGLAFRTSDRKIFLIESDRECEVPIPSPTPSIADTVANSAIHSNVCEASGFTGERSRVQRSNTVFYASVPSTAKVNGNSITKIAPQRSSRTISLHR